MTISSPTCQDFDSSVSSCAHHGTSIAEFFKNPDLSYAFLLKTLLPMKFLPQVLDLSSTKIALLPRIIFKDWFVLTNVQCKMGHIRAEKEATKAMLRAISGLLKTLVWCRRGGIISVINWEARLPGGGQFLCAYANDGEAKNATGKEAHVKNNVTSISISYGVISAVPPSLLIFTFFHNTEALKLYHASYSLVYCN
ncbi:hypothetical protein J6590_017330 [Homalodisca vitripennis]|nr:hypothetical protein J6590_017330 [Homalodisca vitripennis]